MAFAAGALLLSGCHLDMWNQPKYWPQRQTELFADGSSSRPLVPNTVPRGFARLDDVYFSGYQNGKLTPTIPPAAYRKFDNNTKTMLLRGEYQFNNFCQPCHGRAGDGQGMITRRGLGQRRMPANFHTPKLRTIQIGHFYDVITNGYGVMYSYASRIQPEDRWAVAAYVRALQLSQNARLADVPADVRTQLVQGGSETQVDGGAGGQETTDPANDGPGRPGRSAPPMGRGGAQVTSPRAGTYQGQTRTAPTQTTVPTPITGDGGEKR